MWDAESYARAGCRLDEYVNAAEERLRTIAETHVLLQAAYRRDDDPHVSEGKESTCNGRQRRSWHGSCAAVQNIPLNTEATMSGSKAKHICCKLHSLKATYCTSALIYI